MTTYLSPTQATWPESGSKRSLLPGSSVPAPLPILLAAQAKVGWTIDSTATPSGYDLSRLSPEDFQLMESFLMRREQLSPGVRTPLARKVAIRVATKLNIPEKERGSPEALVEKLANEYRNRAQFR